MKNSTWTIAISVALAMSSAALASKRIKFYRNPMNPSITSKVPMKDDMGMDYIPVYEESEEKPLQAVPRRGVIQLGEGQLELSGATLVQVKRGTIEASLPVGGRALSPSRVSLQVPEHDLQHLKPGLEVRLESPSVGEGSFVGKVVALDSLLDPMTRSLRAEVQLQKPVSGLRPESSVTGSVLLKEDEALLIPESAVMYSNGMAYVYLADRQKGTLTARRVKLGLKSPTQLEVTEGLAEDEWISSGPNFLIDSESRFRAPHD